MSGFVNLNRNLYDLHQQQDMAKRVAEAVAADCDALLNERTTIIATLTAFYRAQLSMSSVQPILDLAVKMNPALRDERHQLAVVHSNDALL